MSGTNAPVVDVQALARLARLEISDTEAQSLEKKIGEVLAFIENLQSVTVPATHSTPAHRNVFREDGNPHEPGVFTRELLAAAPTTKGDHIVVRKILTRDE